LVDDDRIEGREARIVFGSRENLVRVEGFNPTKHEWPTGGVELVEAKAILPAPVEKVRI
jgi:hypothetical protein